MFLYKEKHRSTSNNVMYAYLKCSFKQKNISSEVCIFCDTIVTLGIVVAENASANETLLSTMFPINHVKTGCGGSGMLGLKKLSNSFEVFAESLKFF